MIICRCSHRLKQNTYSRCYCSHRLKQNTFARNYLLSLSLSHSHTHSRAYDHVLGSQPAELKKRWSTCQTLKTPAPLYSKSYPAHLHIRVLLEV